MTQSRFQSGDIPTAKARVPRKGCKQTTFGRFVTPHVVYEHMRFLKMGEVRERVCEKNQREAYLRAAMIFATPCHFLLTHINMMLNILQNDNSMSEQQIDS